MADVQDIRRVPKAPAPPQPDPDYSEPRDTDAVLNAAADAARANKTGDDAKITPDEHMDALEWFLADEDDTDLSHAIQINVGGVDEGQRRWIDWVIKPVDMERLRKIRRQAQGGNRRQRRGAFPGAQEIDEVTLNVQTVLAGTVKPDLQAAAKQLGAVDPSIVVRSRFQHKPGLIAQIAGEIMSLSGYDDEDLREVDSARG